MIRVAVSPALSHLKRYLSSQGIEVVNFDQGNLEHLEDEISAIVVSGSDLNILGMQNIVAKVPVISAEGRTAEEVSAEIKEKVTP